MVGSGNITHGKIRRRDADILRRRRDHRIGSLLRTGREHLLLGSCRRRFLYHHRRSRQIAIEIRRRDRVPLQGYPEVSRHAGMRRRDNAGETRVNESIVDTSGSPEDHRSGCIRCDAGWKQRWCVLFSNRRGLFAPRDGTQYIRGVLRDIVQQAEVSALIRKLRHTGSNLVNADKRCAVPAVHRDTSDERRRIASHHRKAHGRTAHNDALRNRSHDTATTGTRNAKNHFLLATYIMTNHRDVP